MLARLSPVFLRTLPVVLWVFSSLIPQRLPAQAPKLPTSAEVQARYGSELNLHLDQDYGSDKNPKQMLDLFLPKKPATKEPLPVIVHIHGGGWTNGDRRGSTGSVMPFVQTGNYAGITVSYRLSGEVKWPAQIHDCKAAIRWIRAHAKEFNLDPERIGVQGGSAGGHLSTLLGLTGDNSALEGSVGPNTKLSSRVSCVVNFCGPSDLTVPLMQGDAALKDDPAVSAFMGGSLADKQAAAKEASPLTYVRKDVVPILIVHGTKDLRVNFTQATALHKALQTAGASVKLIPITDGGHSIQGGPALAKRVQQFYDQQLRGIAAEISEEPIPTQP